MGAFPSQEVRVTVDLNRIRINVTEIRRRTGVDVIAVIKADAYGLGAATVARTIADLVSGFCLFSLEEAEAISLWDIAHKPALTLSPSRGIEPQRYIAAHVRPAVWTAEEAGRLRSARPVLSVDTGMRRFACEKDQIDPTIAAGSIDEAFTHAVRIEHVHKLRVLTEGPKLRLHAAASALLDQPEAYLDAVRPGMAIYRGAVRISTPLVETHEGRSPAGYCGFVADRFGVILCGYAQGLAAGPCLVNGTPRLIREVGMQSALVEIGPGDKTADEVVLLGDALTEAQIATSRGVSEQNALLALAGAGNREYRGH